MSPLTKSNNSVRGSAANKKATAPLIKHCKSFLLGDDDKTER